MRPFESQIRLHKFAVDEVRRRLGDLVRLADQLRADVAALEAEAVREQAVAASSSEVAFAYGAFAPQIIERRARLHRSIAEVDLQVAEAREALTLAFGDLKKFELAAENAEERARRKQQSLEQAALDDIGLTIHRRRGRARSN